MAEPVGFYGKSPARGDFLARRMPPGFTEPWADWLSLLLRESQAQLGQAWQAAWLEAPVWHLALGAGIAGPVPHLGVLFPSVDRAGRFFPFTALGACHAGGLAPDAWWPAAEALTLGALDEQFDPDALDVALQALGAPGHLAIEPGETLFRCHKATLRGTGLPDGRQASMFVRPMMP